MDKSERAFRFQEYNDKNDLVNALKHSEQDKDRKVTLSDSRLLIKDKQLIQYPHDLLMCLGARCILIEK